MIGPEIEVTRDEFAAVVHPNGGGVTDLPAYAFEGLHDVFPFIAEAVHWTKIAIPPELLDRDFKGLPRTK
ncbi:hypothetical protein RvVAT039_13370 [Agrobacterium vitis]|nr:hypothetical protein RvVAT039_13370 [Agrobacterium vitis]